MGTDLLAQVPRGESKAASGFSYAKDNTALLIVDPYNDFMSEGGKMYKQTLETATEVRFYENMRKLIPAVRTAGISSPSCLITERPRETTTTGSPSAPHRRAPNASDCLPRARGVANTCVESTGRYAMELGYHVTLVKDATAAFSKDGMHSAHVVNAPTYAHAITTTAELIAALPQKS